MSSSPAAWRPSFTGRRVGLLGAALLTLTALAALLPEDFVLTALAKVLLGAATAGVLPGLLLAWIFRPARHWGVMELAAVSASVSIALVQAPTMAALLLGLPAWAVTAGYLGLVGLGCLFLILRDGEPVTLVLAPGEGWLLAALALTAALLYVKGSPLASDEDQIHASVVRRLAEAPRPGVENIYPARGVVYTHPYPGTHYFMAVVAKASGCDPLFAYHKLRFYWGLVALLLLYRVAAVIFRRPDLALCSAAAGMVLMLNGSFADFLNLYWAQLAPTSHPSDVALGVLLPALLCMALSYLSAAGAARARFYLAATLLAVVMVSIVHLREVMQFLIYLGCFILACLVCREWRWLMLRRAALVIVLTLAIGGAYAWHHGHVVGHVAAYDKTQKAALWASLRQATTYDLFAAIRPQSMMHSIYVGWMPVLALLAPLALLAYGRRPLVLLVCGSLFAYLAILRIPLLSIALMLATFWEVLVTPVRHYGFLLALLAGPLFYVLAAAAARIGPRWVGVTLAGIAGAALAFVARFPTQTWMARQDWFFLPALAGYAAALAITWCRPRGAEEALAPRLPTSRWAPAFAVLLAVAACLTPTPRQSPLHVRSAPTASHHFLGRVALAWRPADLLAGPRPAVLERYRLSSVHPAFLPVDREFARLEAAAPSVALIRWARAGLPAEAVLACDAFNACPSSMFFPQQMATWPAIASINLVYVKDLWPAYYARFERSMARDREQPFFNVRDTAAEREDFMAAVGATHALIGPPHRDGLLPLLAADTSTYRVLFDDGEWAVVEFVPAGRRPAGLVKGERR